MGYDERSYRGGYNQRGFRPSPVEVGKEYEVDIKEMSRRGEGIARIQGFVIFVSNAKLGVHLKIRITRVGRRAANAEIVR